MTLLPRSAAALAVLTIAVAACGGGSSPATTEPSAPPPNGQQALVLAVLDGDSLAVEIGGVREEVRLIGLNSPERGECLSEESRSSLAALVEGTTVTLERDTTDRDRFDRLLRYVFTEEGFVNEAQVAAGLAIARAFEPDTRRQAELAAAQQEARTETRGMWDTAACGAGDAPALELESVEANPPGRDSDDLNGEWLAIDNPTGQDVPLEGWQVKDGTSQNRFTFPPDFTLRAGASVRVRTGCGDDDRNDVHWCADRPVWDNDGDQAFLLDPDGNIVDYLEY